MSRAIRFCHLIDSASSNPLLFNSVKYSDCKKFDYTVISLEPEGGLQRQMEGIGVESYSINCRSRGGFLRAITTLVKIFRQNNFDVVQVHSFDASLVGLIAASIARVTVRIFSGHHSHEVPLHKNHALLWLDSLLARRLATNVIAPSNNMKDIFVAQHKVPPNRIKVIVHGMDLDQWRESAQISNNIRGELGFENKTLFGAVGRLFWVKGFDTLIKAFAVATKEHDDIALIIAGGGTEESRLRDLISDLDAGEKIKLIGRRSDIAAVMNDLDALIHPSIAESFGLIYLEAFALAKPVIATRRGIAAEIVRDHHNGFLVEPESISEMHEAINKLIGSRNDWARMGSAARAAAERFSVKVTQAECDEHISSLVQGNRE
jgi:glycosyltransferase involved in cell wall biosynthesis